MKRGQEATEEYRDKVNRAADYVDDLVEDWPGMAIILGTGLGGLTEDIDVHQEVPYEAIPGSPVSTVEMHEGRLLVGELDGIPLAAFDGRFHLYEGYSVYEVAFPVRMAGVLGTNTLFISNAAGGMNPQFERSDLMLITDHINLQGVNPLVGPNVDEWGLRFTDMSEPYDLQLRAHAREVALEEGIHLHEGVYVGVVGPNLETKAEYRALRGIGADAVGMSTVPEVLAARHMDIRVMALSCITDECFPDALEPISVPDVIAAAKEAEPSMMQVFKGVFEREFEAVRSTEAG